MRNTLCLASAIVLVGCLGCSKGAPTGATAASLESCFDTGGGHMRCVATPGGITKESRDVDNDGQPDTFVCAIRPAGSNQGADEEKGDDSSEKADASEESGDAHEGNNQEQDDDCAKMGCRDLRKHDGEHGAEQEGKPETDDGKNESDGGSNNEHSDENEHQGGDDMTCPAPSGGTDAGTGSG